jgi:6-phosphogluconolactonase
VNPVEIANFPDTGALVDAVARSWLAELAAGVTVQVNRECTRIDANPTAEHGNAFAPVPPHSRTLAFIRSSTPERLPAGNPGGLPFTIALSGGRIAAGLYQALAIASQNRKELWSNIEFFFADERWVPLDDPESNYALAKQHLFGPLGTPDRHVHPFPTHTVPEFAAAQLQAELLRRTASDWHGNPILDLVILGMGEDGHIASLFPGAPPEVIGSRAVYLPVIGPKPPPQRLTLTYAVLAVARQVWVLITGPGKRPALDAALTAHAANPLGHLLSLRRHTRIFIRTEP